MTGVGTGQHETESRRKRLHRQLHRNRTLSVATKIVITFAGALVILAGVVMTVTPGPGLLAIVAGLAILATEWAWADRWLVTARRKLADGRAAVAAVDPAVQRRRIALAGTGSALVALTGAGYIAFRDWPGWTVSFWNRAQSVAAFLPELPGM